MILEFFLFIFVLGCMVGSFLNVVVDRMPNGQSIAYPPSHCPHCRHKLAFYDLIPLLSFYYLKGRCRYCKAKISWYYPLIEATTGVLFVLTAFSTLHLSGVKIPPNLPLSREGQIVYVVYLIYLLFIISSLIIVFFIDLKYGIIPFKIVIVSLAIITVGHLFVNSYGIALFLNYIFSGVGVFVAFLLLFLVTRGRGIGFGDVVFSLLMGYLLGFPNIILGVYISFLTGAFISLILVVAGRKKIKGGIIPFGPFLVTGTVVSLFWGQVIIDKVLLYFHVF